MSVNDNNIIDFYDYNDNDGVKIMMKSMMMIIMLVMLT